MSLVLLLCCSSGSRPNMPSSCSSTTALCRCGEIPEFPHWNASPKRGVRKNKTKKQVERFSNARILSLLLRLQVNFYTDHTKIILCKSSDDSYLLTYISRERVSYTYLLSMLTDMGCTSELRHRLRYIVQLLQHHADAWERSAATWLGNTSPWAAWLLDGSLLEREEKSLDRTCECSGDDQRDWPWWTSSSQGSCPEQQLPQGFVPIQLMPRRYPCGRYWYLGGVGGDLFIAWNDKFLYWQLPKWMPKLPSFIWNHCICLFLFFSPKVTDQCCSSCLPVIASYPGIVSKRHLNTLTCNETLEV